MSPERQAEQAIQAISGSPVNLNHTGRNWLAVTTVAGRRIGAHGRTPHEALAKLQSELKGRQA